nr:protein kinase-like domain, phloem protein 2-like protein [Tanacetum cinerariifolium]
ESDTIKYDKRLVKRPATIDLSSDSDLKQQKQAGKKAVVTKESLQFTIVTTLAISELIDIFVPKWNKQWDEKEQHFWMEISMLSSLQHKNLVSLVGFCDENDEKILVMKPENYASLENCELLHVFDVGAKIGDVSALRIH